MRKVGIYSTSGDKHTRLRNQMRRLFGCTVSLLYEDARGEATLNAPIARLTEFWWSERQPDARSLWESKIELGEDLFNEIIRCPIPIDLNTLRAMKRSPLDLYLWLTYRTFELTRPLRLTWPLLYKQFGVDPSRSNDKFTIRNFRTDPHGPPPVAPTSAAWRAAVRRAADPRQARPGAGPAQARRRGGGPR